ncbi:unnamed protein product [[Actinomadura] parvosata subsp. kistnae]|uniref:Lipoprotein n=1 Tax=[Actinomadura] parvosata subsp. kistnae TaxID=1909395 RepID=A0A1V0A9H1_9ACTN|nr:hypothetical protein [Nonomuraea sp. ATCC 55076]AQZ66792.1 hypothetical protein BKM31_39880 [Nonomuraea sp. ATCC 55076]SPL95078.1 unnamed protein product [Actinomadura parvosata subsp. kistnae]
MKKALAVAAAAATLLSAAPAQAATPDPVRAVRQQFVAGHGVKFSETLITESKGDKEKFVQISGTYAFGPSGVVASEGTFRERLTKDKTTLHFRTVGRRLYLKGDNLPEGKTWMRVDDDAFKTPLTLQPVDILRLPQLKGLLSHTTSVRNGAYRGSVTAKQARELGGDRAPAGYDFRLSTDSSGLPTHLRTQEIADRTTVSVYDDTRYSAWGHKVTITDPPDHEVIDMDDIADSTFDETLEEILDLADNAVAAGRR